MIVGLIIPHRKYLTITKIREGRPRPGPGCSATDDDDDIRMHERNIFTQKLHFKSTSKKEFNMAV
jgi:hypothetical protein